MAPQLQLQPGKTHCSSSPPVHSPNLSLDLTFACRFQAGWLGFVGKHGDFNMVMTPEALRSFCIA